MQHSTREDAELKKKTQKKEGLAETDQNQGETTDPIEITLNQKKKIQQVGQTQKRPFLGN